MEEEKEEEKKETESQLQNLCDDKITSHDIL